MQRGCQETRATYFNKAVPIQTEGDASKFSIWLKEEAISLVEPSESEPGDWSTFPQKSFTALTNLIFLYRLQFSIGIIWVEESGLARAPSTGDVMESDEPSAVMSSAPPSGWFLQQTLQTRWFQFKTCFGQLVGFFSPQMMVISTVIVCDVILLQHQQLKVKSDWTKQGVEKEEKASGGVCILGHISDGGVQDRDPHAPPTK